MGARSFGSPPDVGADDESEDVDVLDVPPDGVVLLLLSEDLKLHAPTTIVTTTAHQDLRIAPRYSIAASRGKR